MLPHDKTLHFVLGAIIALGGTVVAGQFGLARSDAMWIGGALCFATAVAKEVRDSRGRGCVEVADALWTCAGGLVILGAFTIC